MRVWYAGNGLPKYDPAEVNAWAQVRGRSVTFVRPGQFVLTAPDSPELRAWLELAPLAGVEILGVEE